MGKIWNIDSWRSFPITQQPNWEKVPHYQSVINTLKKLPSLVFSGETRLLKEEISRENNFILQIGNCAETFDDCNGPKIHNYLKIFLQMSMIIEHRTKKDVIKIGRVAGQYAKPRSTDYEQLNGQVLPSYRGDIINSYEPIIELRTPNPSNMIEAYFRSAATLNLIRAFIQGGYSDISNWDDWNKHFFTKEISDYSRYQSFIKELANSINTGILTFNSLHNTNIYISHESLLLDYEEAFTRFDTTHGGYYDTSAHFLWIGERTRSINGAHIEFIRGIGNPIGIKVGPNANLDEIISLVKTINPENISGKVVLIIRMGKSGIRNSLRPLLKSIKKNSLNVTIISDPMHGNTYTHNSIKVRAFDDITQELYFFFKICKEENSIPSGVHLELTSDNVTECIGGLTGLGYEDLDKNYTSKVDPRLNAAQALELAFFISDLINSNK